LLVSNLEESLRSRGSELSHLQLRNSKAILIDVVNDLPSMNVYIRLDHCKGGFFVGSKVASGEGVAIVCEL
jgi:hypothetical protein